jgi:hypothetical protein
MRALSPARSSKIVSLVLLGLVLSAPAHGDKLKGIYAGSGGFSQDVSRTLFIEFAADGTALLQQQWVNKDPQTWHARWKQEKKKITLTYEAAKNQDAKGTPLPAPLIFDFKDGTLTATSWDTPTLGLLGPPKLTPFGGKNPQVNSVAGCQSLNTADPSRYCVTWGSNR